MVVAEHIPVEEGSPNENLVEDSDANDELNNSPSSPESSDSMNDIAVDDEVEPVDDVSSAESHSAEESVNESSAEVEPHLPTRDVRPGVRARTSPSEGDQASESIVNRVPVDPNVPVSIEIVDADEQSRMVNEFVQQALEEERKRTILAQVIPNIDDAEVIDDDTPAPPKSRFKLKWRSRGWKLVVLVAVVLGAIAVIVSAVITTRDDDRMAPSLAPSAMPDIEPLPTLTPSLRVAPSATPSSAPSITPTISPAPTLGSVSTSLAVFNQRFQVRNDRKFNQTEQGWFCENMVEYNDDFGGDDRLVSTTCRVRSQRLQIIGSNRRLEHQKDPRRSLQGAVFNQVEYAMSYSSSHVNVTWYPTFIQNYVNEDLDRLTTDLQNRGLPVTNSFLAFNNIAATRSPTNVPTISPYPTVAPVPGLTVGPSLVFTRDPVTPIETAVPTLDGSPTEPEENSGGPKRSRVVTVTVIVALSVVLVALFVFHRRCTTHQ